MPATTEPYWPATHRILIESHSMVMDVGLQAAYMAECENQVWLLYGESVNSLSSYYSSEPWHPWLYLIPEDAHDECSCEILIEENLATITPNPHCKYWGHYL